MSRWDREPWRKLKGVEMNKDCSVRKIEASEIGRASKMKK
jgi:hypothetical protein